MFGIEKIREKRRAISEAERIISGKDEMERTSLDVDRKIREEMRGRKNSVETGVHLLSDEPHKDDIRVPFTLSYETFAVVRSAISTPRSTVLQRGLDYPLCESRRGSVQTCISNAIQNEDGNVSIALSVVELEILNGDLRRDPKYLPELLDVNLAFARDSGRSDINYSDTAAHPLVSQTSKKSSGW